MLNLNVKRFILSSTSSVYGLNKGFIDETDSFDCLNPYSLFKLFSEQISNYYNKNFNLPVIILRYFNVFGARAPSNGQYACDRNIYETVQTKSAFNNSWMEVVFVTLSVDDVAKANIIFINQKQKNEFIVLLM